MTSSARLYFIDNLKGILILLVILGHCVQMTVADFDHHPLLRFIYSFHMPLFMAVSGYVSYKPELKWDSVGKRFIQLMVPFFAWLLIATLRAGDITHFFNGLIRPDVGLWFLWVLFFISVLVVFAHKLSVRTKIGMGWYAGAFAVIIIGVVAAYKIKILGIHETGWYLIFYCLGFFMRKFDKSGKSIPMSVAIACALVFACLVPFWMRKEPPTFLHISSAMPAMAANYAYKLVVAGFAVIAFIALAKRYLNCNMPIIGRLGGVTLGIYAIHQPLLDILISGLAAIGLEIGGSWAIIIGLFIVATLISYGIYSLLNKTDITSTLFLGKRKKKNI